LKRSSLLGARTSGANAQAFRTVFFCVAQLKKRRGEKKHKNNPSTHEGMATFENKY
jgi:hypothetical protein